MAADEIDESDDRAGQFTQDDPTRGDSDSPVRESLLPRQRRLAELIVQGHSDAEIAKKLDLTVRTVELLKDHRRVKDEILNIKERVYEESIETRLKRIAEPALNLIEQTIMDRSNRIKDNVKIETAKWLIEKLDGKAAQKVEVGGSLLSEMLDRLDNLKRAGLSDANIIDVSPSQSQVKVIANLNELPNDAIKVEREEDPLKEWVNDFNMR